MLYICCSCKTGIHTDLDELVASSKAKNKITYHRNLCQIGWSTTPWQHVVANERLI